MIQQDTNQLQPMALVQRMMMSARSQPNGSLHWLQDKNDKPSGARRVCGINKGARTARHNMTGPPQKISVTLAC